MLETEQRRLNDSLRVAKKRLKAQGSFNPQFWSRAAEVEGILLERIKVERKISLRDFSGPEAEWQKTEEAKMLFEQIRAHEVTTAACNKRIEQLEPRASWGRRLRASFMKLFTTSKMGLGIKNTGAGERDGRSQTQFRTDMIEVYGSRNPERDEYLWCPIMGKYFHKRLMTAAHLFAYMHGQDTMGAIFGVTKTPELFSPRNGLMMASFIEDVFDCGKIVIVPDLPDRPKLAELLAWLGQETREYKVRILDQNWKLLGKTIELGSQMTYRELDGRRLQFKTAFRPAARYIYFHYCLQVLRRAWQENTDGTPGATIRDEMGKPFWGTPGRYLPKNMLLALVEELGHDYKDLLCGASGQKGEEGLLVEVAAKQVKARRKRLCDSGFGDDEDEDYESDEEGDGGESDSESTSNQD
ncbi:HNH endonuclease signature motif containing protein [Aspergillus ibericus CBS 121593]|uniref:HNH nuclease domain-containing protein n=1 Tax=Aspergillus ibericus CBS 121593 TaxID=1448316 RepID=A0A395GN49_9EURO|nr:hypothetical protein BO80DRAFT_459812 [Aspergillus ibericus CBS 121593]RAK95443.1 hypothetical protein BO80DRAFT_459812 [Aspergillus ibericus CBS 121593]